GDLFDWWPGDDSNQFNKVITLLKEISKKSKIFFICGNRDYLIGKKFAKDTNITILPDHELIKLGKEKTIILHGDTLCTDDKKYQRFRKFSRSWVSKKVFLLLPKYLKDVIFNFARQKSNYDKSYKEQDIMDVNTLAVEKLFNKFNNPPIMIHGHTHRPKIHNYKFNGVKSKRVVLNDWYESGSFLLWDKGKLKNIKI
ncbi:UDP-2,3-diacylglucosamine diphosphatase, partial [Methylophilaceae bacterium]|nr:UDP-2,3-diacylglucosamine diphosphatase [Methylophilaceae bacterium]